MSVTYRKFLKFINFLTIAITLALWSVFFYNFFNLSHLENTKIFLAHYPSIFSFPLLLIFSVIILLKADSNKGVLLFALFLSMISQNAVFVFLRMLNNTWIPTLETVLTISYALTGTIFIKSLQSFPKQLNEKDCKH